MSGRADARSARGLRVVRGSAAAGVAVLFASTAHTLSGGEAPAPWLVAAVTILAAPLCILLVGRRLSPAGLSAAVVSAQAALHGAFSAVGSAAPGGPASALGAPGGHHHPMPALAALPTIDAVTGAMAVMTAGHGIAAALTIGVLAWGERLLVAIARGIRRLLSRPEGPALPGPVASLGIISSRRIAATALLECITRRGPPARPSTAR